MTVYTTNYKNTFIEIAEDCTANSGEVPPMRGSNKTVANYQYEMLHGNPYKHTSDDVKFNVYAARKGIKEDDREKERAVFFSKGQPCFRTSPLTKRYGWGIHCNEEGKVAMYGVETEDYKKFTEDSTVKKVKAMRSKSK